MKNRLENTKKLMAKLGIEEEPFGIYNSDQKPEKAFGPKEGIEISRTLEAEGKIDWGEVMKTFSCVMGNIWLARKKKAAAFISAKEYGCPGGCFYTGVHPEYYDFITYYVSTGFPGTPIHGERYMPSPAAMRKWLDHFDFPKTKTRYCLFKPLSLFDDAEQPEFVTFFCRQEAMNGLATLVYFTTGDWDAVATPFGPGCSHLVAWPRHYQKEGKERAVLGTFDPSARKFMKGDEIFLTIPIGLYDRMLEAAPESLLETETWGSVMKKVGRSKEAWEKK